MFRLDNAIRDYAWGSTHEIAAFLGTAASGGPQAELWIGAHPGDPSRCPDGTTLDELIGADPDRHLGADVRSAFGARLPFLMKVLSVNEPLSLQVHPDPAQAVDGHRRELAAGLPFDDQRRNYKDPWHKPELVVALTRFEGMAGFRDTAASARLLRMLELGWADELAARIEAGPAAECLRTETSRILSRDVPGLSDRLIELATAAEKAANRLRSETAFGASDSVQLRDRLEAARVFSMVVELADRYPDDPGVLVALLLNHVMLDPGEALFVDSGVVHAYCSGLGLEIMATSDNVLRAGLTPKHMDVAEVLAVTDFAPIPPPRWSPSEPRTPGTDCFQPPVGDFRLQVSTATPEPATVPATAGPRVLLVLDGDVEVSPANADPVRLTRGAAVFIGHDDGAVQVRGEGRFAVGSVPEVHHARDRAVEPPAQA